MPLDRLDPSSNARIRIGFELYPRSEANRPSLGTLVFMEGGPGYSTTASRDWYLDLARNLTARRDVLLVDARGTGRSGALNCPALQSYTGDYLANARACAQQLGATATLYGSGNAAEDLVAVLDELGIQKVDLYGDSYGTFNAQTFAVRHPERVRSLTLDGAYPIAGPRPLVPRHDPRARPRLPPHLRSLRRELPGRVANNADDAIASFAAALDAHPVSGTAPDADGVEHEVEATVDSLISTASAADSQTVVYRELLATKAALNAGDTAPLLRLVAETTYWGDGGPVREYSEAHYLAVACHDYPWSYDLHQPTAVRLQQLDAARAALPMNLFFPFPRDDWATSSWMSYDLCVTWPAPLHDDPPLPAGAHVPERADARAQRRPRSAHLERGRPARRGELPGVDLRRGRQPRPRHRAQRLRRLHRAARARLLAEPDGARRELRAAATTARSASSRRSRAASTTSAGSLEQRHRAAARCAARRCSRPRRPPT